MNIVNQIENFTPKHEFFIGVDSDGCAFDSMGIKHKKVFIPIAIELWGLEKIQKEFTEVEEFVNLYSQTRGINRFPGFLLTLDYLKEKLKSENIDFLLPDYEDLREFTSSGMPMSNQSLVEFMQNKKSCFLSQVLEWSYECDKLFSQLTKGLQPFDYVREALAKAYKKADTMVVSAASSEGLHKDWKEGGILQYMTLVAGQESGSKKEQLKLAAKGMYKKGHVLMIGDAPGDLKAARENGALFYPINPGNEVESWKRFSDEVLYKFICGEYEGKYEEGQIKEFLELLHC